MALIHKYPLSHVKTHPKEAPGINASFNKAQEAKLQALSVRGVSPHRWAIISERGGFNGAA